MRLPPIPMRSDRVGSFDARKSGHPKGRSEGRPEAERESAETEGCAEHVRMLGSESLLLNLMEVKG